VVLGADVFLHAEFVFVRPIFVPVVTHVVQLHQAAELSGERAAAMGVGAAVAVLYLRHRFFSLGGLIIRTRSTLPPARCCPPELPWPLPPLCWPPWPAPWPRAPLSFFLLLAPPLPPPPCCRPPCFCWPLFWPPLASGRQPAFCPHHQLRHCSAMAGRSRKLVSDSQ
jgi:hypothetical protein